MCIKLLCLLVLLCSFCTFSPCSVCFPVGRYFNAFSTLIYYSRFTLKFSNNKKRNEIRTRSHKIVQVHKGSTMKKESTTKSDVWMGLWLIWFVFNCSVTHNTGTGGGLSYTAVLFCFYLFMDICNWITNGLRTYFYSVIFFFDSISCLCHCFLFSSFNNAFCFHFLFYSDIQLSITSKSNHSCSSNGINRYHFIGYESVSTVCFQTLIGQQMNGTRCLPPRQCQNKRKPKLRE